MSSGLKGSVLRLHSGTRRSHAAVEAVSGGPRVGASVDETGPRDLGASRGGRRTSLRHGMRPRVGRGLGDRRSSRAVRPRLQGPVAVALPPPATTMETSSETRSGVGTFENERREGPDETSVRVTRRRDPVDPNRRDPPTVRGAGPSNHINSVTFMPAYVDRRHDESHRAGDVAGRTWGTAGVRVPALRGDTARGDGRLSLLRADGRRHVRHRGVARGERGGEEPGGDVAVRHVRRGGQPLNPSP